MAEAVAADALADWVDARLCQKYAWMLDSAAAAVCGALAAWHPMQATLARLADLAAAHGDDDLAAKARGLFPAVDAAAAALPLCLDDAALAALVAALSDAQARLARCAEMAAGADWAAPALFRLRFRWQRRAVDRQTAALAVAARIAAPLAHKVGWLRSELLGPIPRIISEVDDQQRILGLAEKARVIATRHQKSCRRLDELAHDNLLNKASALREQLAQLNDVAREMLAPLIEFARSVAAAGKQPGPIGKLSPEEAALVFKFSASLSQSPFDAGVLNPIEQFLEYIPLVRQAAELEAFAVSKPKQAAVVAALHDFSRKRLRDRFALWKTTKTELDNLERTAAYIRRTAELDVAQSTAEATEAALVKAKDELARHEKRAKENQRLFELHQRKLEVLCRSEFRCKVTVVR